MCLQAASHGLYDVAGQLHLNVSIPSLWVLVTIYFLPFEPISKYFLSQFIPWIYEKYLALPSKICKKEKCKITWRSKEGSVYSRII